VIGNWFKYFFKNSGDIGSIFANRVSVYADLPTPAINFQTKLYWVNSGSGGFMSWAGRYKYPAGPYNVNTDTGEWEQAPFSVKVSEDTQTVLNIPDDAAWLIYISVAKDINYFDRIIFKGVDYRNKTGSQTTTTPDIDTTNWSLLTPKVYSIKIVGTTLLETPEAGMIEYYGNRFYLSESNVSRRVISIASDVKISDTTVVNTITKTAVFTATAQAETANGKYYRIPLFGYFSCASASHTVTISWEVNGSTLTRTITPGVRANKPWHSNLTFIIRTTGASGTFVAMADLDFDDVSYDADPVSGSIDTTIPHNIVVSVQWSSALAGNSITCMGGILEDMN